MAKVLLVVGDDLLARIDAAAAAVEVSRSAWLRMAAAAALGEPPPIGHRVQSARVVPRMAGKSQEHARLVAQSVLPREFEAEPFEDGA